MLEVTDLRVKLGALEILRGVSLSVPARGVVSVLGANGVGKTTLLRTLSGIYAPAAAPSASTARRSAACPATRSSPAASPRRPRAGRSSAP
jgi:branched-chain amino acid transport system ATP-binding protein